MSKNKDKFIENTVKIILVVFILFLAVVTIGIKEPKEPSYESDVDGLEASLEFDEDELKDDVWQIEEIFVDRITVSVNGKVVHGDKYRVWFEPIDEGYCNNPYSSTTFLSVVENAEEKFKNLPSHILASKINNEEYWIKIASIHDFLSVKSALIDLGVRPIDELISFYEGYDEIEIELTGFYDLDKDEVMQDDINEYFAFPRNVYSLDGFENAIASGQAKCLHLVDDKS